MTDRDPAHLIIIGAGSAGLMAARELARAGKQVTILEARERCGGRIWALPVEEFGYAAEGGAEFVHGTAPMTRALMREAGLSLSPLQGRRWDARKGSLSRDEPRPADMARLYQALRELKADLPVAEFLETHFAADRYRGVRRTITRMVEGYDAADPRRASTFALRDEWMDRGSDRQGRITKGYGALIDHLASNCRRHGVAIRHRAEVTAIDEGRHGVTAYCRDGAAVEADVALVAVPLPLLSAIALPPTAREKAAVCVEIGYGNVVKILLRFHTRWWADRGESDLTDLSFLFSNATVPTWWTQHPADDPVLTGWFAGPKADTVPHLAEAELVNMGLASLAEIFDLSGEHLAENVTAYRAINWGNDPFARGAYSYATPKTRAAQTELKKPNGGRVFFSGEALYAGPDMGTVEAALTSGLETARMILAAPAV